MLKEGAYYVWHGVLLEVHIHTRRDSLHKRQYTTGYGMDSTHDPLESLGHRQGITVDGFSELPLFPGHTFWGLHAPRCRAKRVCNLRKRGGA